MGRATARALGMTSHPLFACTLCDAPIQMNGNSGYVSLDIEKRYRRREAVILDMGYSRGGWGHRQQWLTFSSETVCGECFDKIADLVRPLQQFIHGDEQADPIQPMWGQEPSPKGRGASVLQSVRALLPVRRA
jgi:hypothetical protein